MACCIIGSSVWQREHASMSAMCVSASVSSYARCRLSCSPSSFPTSTSVLSPARRIPHIPPVTRPSPSDLAPSHACPLASLFLFGQDGYLPLHYAAKHQAPVEVVRALLDAYPEAAKEKRVGRSASVWSCVLLCVWSHVSSCASWRVCVLMCVGACCSLSVRASVFVGGCEHAHNHSKVSVYRGLLHHWFVCVAA